MDNDWEEKVELIDGQVFYEKKHPKQSYLWNPDIHPSPKNLRTWRAPTYAYIWVSMAVIVPTWTLSTVGMAMGLNWIQVLVYMFLGNVIILIPTIIQSHGGARYGLPEPQLTRTRWGIYAAQVPSWIRAIISMGWWGVESFIIAEAGTYIYFIASGVHISSALLGKIGPGVLPLYFPGLFWGVFIAVIVAQIAIFYISPPTKGQTPLRILAKVATPIMIASFFGMFYLFASAGNFNFTPITTFNTSGGSALAQIAFLNANVAYWATMAVSMPDYTRFAKSQYSQTVGQIPMPFLMVTIGALGLISAGVAINLGWFHVTSTLGFFSYDPLELLAIHFPAYFSIPILFGVIVATFSVNVFANSIAPGYDISNTYPKRLTWFRGILIGIAISIIVGAYTAYSSSVHDYVFNWLLTYGALLGVVEGTIVFDYLILRRLKFNIRHLYKKRGFYYFWKGINPAAVIAGIVAIIITYAYPWGLSHAYAFEVLFNNSWITAFLISGVLDVILNVVWILPRYNKFGSLRTGYIDDETRTLFETKKPIFIKEED